jgi:channel protein (hemolysin III family)
MDHCSIYVLIAGTYTPLALITLGHTATGIGLCVAQWVS